MLQRPRGNTHGLFDRPKLQRVPEDDANGPLEHRGVGRKKRKGRGHLHVDAPPLDVLRGEDFSHEVTQRGRRQLGCHVVGLQSTHVDEVVDQPGQTSSLPRRRLPVVLAARWPAPWRSLRIYRRPHSPARAVSYDALRRFHAPAAATLAPTLSIRNELTRRGFEKVKVWTRGVDHRLYRPRPPDAIDLPRPIFLSVGRVAVEKNLDALLQLKLPGSVVVVGEGRRAPASSAASRTRISSARCTAKRWRASTPAPTCSSSPRGPTPSASC